MDIKYLDWKKENVVEYYKGLIDQAKHDNSPVAPINHDQRPNKMTIEELTDIINKRGLVNLAKLITDIVNERDNEIDLFNKCQNMIKDYNFSNYDKMKQNIDKICGQTT